MAKSIRINNEPNVNEVWAGIGGYFDSLGQIINEFIDNSVSNFESKAPELKNIIITLEERSDSVKIIVEDTGTGIGNLNSAFTLGGKECAESPLNEHGFGMKHAIASANPNNDAWYILTRTDEDLKNDEYKKISAPYKIYDFKADIVNGAWPGDMNKTGTIVCFECTKEMYRTLGRGMRGGNRGFVNLADLLCEDIGFVYSTIIKAGKANIRLKIKPIDDAIINRDVGAIEPNWVSFFPPRMGREKFDLGNGDITIKYNFGRVSEKSDRLIFDNSTAKKYYKQNASSSGVEIRINGRVLTYNLFKEIWGYEKHNSYNDLLIIVDLCSENSEALPKTRTSKNGFREGDPLLENLYGWIKSKYPEPQKKSSISDHETDLFTQLKEIYEQSIGLTDPNVVIKTEMHGFTKTGNNADRIRVDMYMNTNGKTYIFEGKKDITTASDVYKLKMYWDSLVYDGVTPDVGYLVASEHTSSVIDLVNIVNSMNDMGGSNYHFELKTWIELGVKYSFGKLD